MTQTSELNNAWRFVETTGVSIFLTGKAGTGKTTFLRNLRAQSHKTMVVVAPTGVAAVNAGGVTIHSFFQLPLSPYVPGTEVRDKYNFSKDKQKIIRALDLLVIDEISMVRSDLLDAIDHVLRRYRRSSEPFGGVQLLMIGDLQQLTPVVTPADVEILRNHYDTPYFFGSRALQQIDYVTIQLTKVFRQQDERFISLLNNIRDSRLTPDDAKALASRLMPGFRPEPGSDFIRLTTHNSLADDYNRTQLLLLDSPQKSFDAEVKGTFPDYSYPTDSCLTLKQGAQVMFVRNDSSAEHRYYNGRIGHVVGFDGDAVLVKCPGDERHIVVEPQTWENARYTINEKTQEVETEVQGTFTQLPLRLAWSITIHKSQGLTFDHAIIDAGLSFAPGQVYVALSRCKTLEGLVLSSPIDQSVIMSDSRVESYISRQEAEAQRSIERLPEIERDYFRRLLIRLFDFSDVAGLQERLTRLLAESYHSMFPAVTRRQGDMMNLINKDITTVSSKWAQLIMTMPYESLTSADFSNRVKKSATYFMDKLVEYIGQYGKEVRSVTSANKTVVKRLDTIREDFYTAYTQKILLLKKIAEDGFDVEKYLRFKQQSILSGGKAAKPASASKLAAANAARVAREERARLREEARQAKKQAKEEARELKRIEKANKIPSHKLTFDRFKEGATREEIAIERQLAVSTIMSHLLHYVDTGELTLKDILGSQAAEIEKTILKFGVETPVAELQQHLAGVHPTDIYAVLRFLRADKKD